MSCFHLAIIDTIISKPYSYNTHRNTYLDILRHLFCRSMDNNVNENTFLIHENLLVVLLRSVPYCLCKILAHPYLSRVYLAYKNKKNYLLSF